MSKFSGLSIMELWILYSGLENMGEVKLKDEELKLQREIGDELEMRGQVIPQPFSG